MQWYNRNMSKYHFVINPAGASGRTGKEWEKLKPLCQKYGISFEEHFTTVTEGMTEICRKLTGDLREDIDLVIVGGDGSFNEALNGIRDFEHTRIGLIPCGSGNDFALSMNLPHAREALVRKLAEDKVSRILDVGEVTVLDSVDRYDALSDTFDASYSTEPVVRRFNNAVGIGFDAEICRHVITSRFKKPLNKIHLGKLIYLVVAMRLIFKNRKTAARILTDGKEQKYEQMMFSVCMNQPYEGGGFKFCPHAEADDGLLDTCTAYDLGSGAFFRLFPKAYNGGHIGHEGVDEGRGKVILIETEDPLWVQTDGEIICRSRKISVTVIPKKLQFLL